MVEKLEDQEESMEEFVERKGKSFNSQCKDLLTLFQKSIPSTDIQALPVGQRMVLGVSLHLLSFLAFVFFLYSGYETGIKNKFLSLQPDAGSCSVVLSPVSGNYMADIEGNWEGSNDFVYSNALYQFSFFNLLKDETEFTGMIDSVHERALLLGQYALHGNLAVNILAWFSFQYSFNDGGAKQWFGYTGDPLTVFGRDLITGTVGNLQSDCNLESSCSFDEATGIESISFSYADFMANENCSSVLIPEELGYSSIYDNDFFQVSFDTRTLLTALAVNSGVLTVDQLEPVKNENGSYFYGSVSYGNDTAYANSNYYDPRYPGMDTVGCSSIESLGNASFCWVQIGSLYGIPLMNHYGDSDEYPNMCVCEPYVNLGGDTMPTNGLNDKCNEFNFLTGVLLFPNMTYDDSIAATLEIASKYGANVSNYAYSALYAAAKIAVTDKYQNSAFRENAYGFCETSYGSCSIISLNIYDQSGHAVSSYYYQLLNGSCVDSFSGKVASWEKLAYNPPVSVVENYYECSQIWSTSLTDSAGIATGFISTLIPFFALLLLQLWSIWRMTLGKEHYANKYVDDCDQDDPADDEDMSVHQSNCQGFQQSMVDSAEHRASLNYRIYSKETRGAMLDSVALQLLMMRDQRLPPLSPTDPESESVLHKLMHEMKANISEDKANMITVAYYSNMPDYLHDLRVKKKALNEGPLVTSFSTMHEMQDSRMSQGVELQSLSSTRSMGSTGDVRGSTSTGQSSQLPDSVQERKISYLAYQLSTLRQLMVKQQDETDELCKELQSENVLLKQKLLSQQKIVEDLRLSFLKCQTTKKG